jgi:diguanylate cyclase (GGDEF)-like protein/PAS domain S-box-containing protein
VQKSASIRSNGIPGTSVLFPGRGDTVRGNTVRVLPWLVATAAAAFGSMALLELLRAVIDPGIHQPFAAITNILLGGLLMTGVALVARRDVLLEARGLKRERELFQAIADSLPSGVFAKDRKGRFVFTNREFAEYKEKTDADILGKTVFDFFSEEFAAKTAAEDLELISGKSQLFDREVSTVDSRGNVKWEMTTRVPLIGASGETMGIVGIQRDITQTKRVEQKLREQEARLLATQQIAQLGNFEVDLIDGVTFDQCPMHCSAELLRMAGFEPSGGDLPDTSRNIFHFIAAEDWNQAREKIAAAIRDAKPYTLDLRIHCRDGTQRHVQCAGDVLCEPETGKPLKLQGIVNDITDRKRAEAKLEAANEKLARHVGELQQRSTELQLLGEIGGVLQSCHTMDEAYGVIAGSMEPLFPNWIGALYTISASKNAVEVAAQWGPPVFGERVFQPEDCWALRRARMHWFNGKENGMRCRHAEAPQVTESVCVPVMAQGEALGILHLQPKDASTRADHLWARRAQNDGKLAILLAEQVGLALGNLKLRETLRNQSVRDALTGLFNRRYLEESLEREISRAVREKSTMAVLMMDVDHFQDFNDTYGHLLGDAALRAIGDFLKKNTRGHDIACRYGGEEFALVFSGSAPDGALMRAEALREGIKRLEVRSQGELLRTITASIGIAIFPDHGLTVADVLRSADQALRSAKQSGRDQICVWSAGSLA